MVVAELVNKNQLLKGWLSGEWKVEDSREGRKTILHLIKNNVLSSAV